MESAAEVLEQIDDLLDRLVELDPRVLADDESVLRLHCQLSRAEAAVTRVTAAWDAGRSWSDGGAKSAAAWLAGMTHLPRSTAARRVRLGRACRHLPHAEAAWLAGEIDGTHVSLLARARTPAAAADLARDEEMLVGQAKILRFSQFQRAVTYWRHLADAANVEDEAEKQIEDRRVDLSQTFQGTWVGNIVLDPIRGAIVSNVLERIDTELFKADWAEAKARLGREPVLAELRRTPAQRRADALVEMARRAATAPKDGKRPEPLFTTLVGYETLHGPVCELANGTVISPGSLLAWLDDAWIERIVFDARSRPIDVGVRKRLFTGATRRAVEVRDRECHHDLCEIPAEECQIDHIKRWTDGGTTTTDNGQPACPFHNRFRERRPDTG